MTNCRQAAAMVCPLPSPPPWAPKRLHRQADGNVAAVSHGQHVLTPTAAAAWCTNTAVSKAACDLHLLTLKVVSESRVTWATSVPILVFLGLSVLDLGPMYATDVRQKHHLMPPPIRGGAITNLTATYHIKNHGSCKKRARDKMQSGADLNGDNLRISICRSVITVG